MPLEHDRPAPLDEPTTELVRETVGLVRELVRAEIALAKEELGREAAALKVSVAAWAVALASVGFGVAMVLVATGVALGWLATLILGVALIVAGGVAAAVGRARAPRTPMAETRRRLAVDERLVRLKEGSV
jgi:hypothetical protein